MFSKQYRIRISTPRVRTRLRAERMKKNKKTKQSMRVLTSAAANRSRDRAVCGPPWINRAVVLRVENDGVISVRNRLSRAVGRTDVWRGYSRAASSALRPGAASSAARISCRRDVIAATWADRNTVRDQWWPKLDGAFGRSKRKIWKLLRSRLAGYATVWSTDWRTLERAWEGDCIFFLIILRFEHEFVFSVRRSLNLRIYFYTVITGKINN